MKLTPALARLADEIATADRIGLSAGPEKLRVWAKLAADVVAGAANEWLPEAAFRLRTGAHPKWCRRHFTRCERAGLARRDPKGRHEWNVSARPPRARASDREDRVREIVASFEKVA